MPFYRFHTHEVFFLQSKNTDMKENSGIRNKEFVDLSLRNIQVKVDGYSFMLKKLAGPQLYL